MKIWTQEEYERFASRIKKSAMKLAFDILFYTGIRSRELLALTPEGILPDKRLNSNKNYAKLKGMSFSLSPKHQRIGGRSLFRISYMMIYKSMYRSYTESCPRTGSSIFTKSALEKELKRNAPAAGLEPILLHDLRHPYVKPTTKKLSSKAEIPDYHILLV